MVVGVLISTRFFFFRLTLREQTIRTRGTGVIPVYVPNRFLFLSLYSVPAFAGIVLRGA